MSELTLTNTNFESEVLQSSQVTLVDFWATWCGPCQMMGPVIQELADEMKSKAKIGKLEIEENPETAQKYDVMSIPTFIIFKEGQEVDRFTGAQTKEALTQKVQKYLNE